MTSTLDVRHLSVEYSAPVGFFPLVGDVSISLPSSRLTAVIGESGSGKTSFARALTRLFSRPERYRIRGSALLRGTDLLSLDAESMRSVRRTSIRYVFQEPSESMNPLLRVGTVMRDAAPPEQATGMDEFLCTALERVGLSEPRRVMRSFPHELSIGMLQRAAIAMALLPNPALLIADEPTSALDEQTKWQILDLLQSVHASAGCTSLVVTHDPAVIALGASRVAVLFAGQVVEINDRQPFSSEAVHPYSRQLTGQEPAVRPESFRGDAQGCAFKSRCPRVHDRCRNEMPSMEHAAENLWVRCFYWT